MTKQIGSIELLFSNVESVIIHHHHIGELKILGITENIARQSLTNIDEFLTAENLIFQLSSEADNKDSYSYTSNTNKLNPFERINAADDIQSVIFYYNDSTTKSFEIHNHQQTSAINETTGDMYLIISNTRLKASDYFKKEIEDKRTPRIWNEIKQTEIN